jgi:hypothetical protein
VRHGAEAGCAGGCCPSPRCCCAANLHGRRTSRATARERGPTRQIAGPVHYKPADHFWFAALSSLTTRHRRHDIVPVQPATLLARHRRFNAAKCDYTARRRPTGRPTHPPRDQNSSYAWPARTLGGGTGGSGATWPGSDTGSPHRPCVEDPQQRRHRSAPRRRRPSWKEFLDPSPTASSQLTTSTSIHRAPQTSLRPRLSRAPNSTTAHHRRHRHPSQEWTAQQAGNLTADPDTHVDSPRHVLRDRDAKYSPAFDAVFRAEGMDLFASPPRAPRTNAHCEPVIRTLRN